MKKFLAAASIAGFLALTAGAAGAAYVANTSNFMEQGGADWEVGGVLNVDSGGLETVQSGGAVNIASGGALKIAGTDVTANLAATVSKPVADPTSGVRVAAGTGALSSGTFAFSSGLTTITECTASIQESSAPGVATTTVTVQWSGATATVYGWKPTSNANPTLIAATGTETVDVICFGT